MCSISELLRKIIDREGPFCKHLPPVSRWIKSVRPDRYVLLQKKKERLERGSLFFLPCRRAPPPPQASKGGPEGMLTAAAARRGPAAAVAVAAWAAPAFHSSAPALSKSTVSPYLVTSSPPCIFTYSICLLTSREDARGD